MRDIGILVLLIFIACKSGSDSSGTRDLIVPPDEKTPDDSKDEESPPTSAYTFKTNIKFVNLTSTQLEKMESALAIIEKVVASDDFKNRVINHRYNGEYTYVANKGLTNSQIYQRILNGAETLWPEIDNEMDMEVEMYTADNNVVGYTYANSKRVWVNTKFFNQYSAVGVARNLMHEWTHKLGFTHDSAYSPSRDYSVPYAIGTIVGIVGKDFL